MGCGMCKSRSCEKQTLQREMSLSPIVAAPPLKSHTESWLSEHPKLFTVNEEPSGMEESGLTFRRLDSKVKTSKSLNSATRQPLNS